MSTTKPPTQRESGYVFPKRTGGLSPVPAAITVAAAFLIGGIAAGSFPMWGFLLIAVVVGAVTWYATNRNR